MSDIEDDATTQCANRDDVEESGDEPTTQRVKKTKGKQRAQPAQPQQEVADGSDSDSDAALDMDNFPDQLLKFAQLEQLSGLAKDWRTLAEAVSRPFGKYGMAAGALADLEDDDAKTVRMILLTSVSRVT
jgi:hypothetical protein